MVLNGVQPFALATYWALANCHAHIDDAPICRALPAFTTSCSASMVTSMGVTGSHRWIWYRST